jgi:hypothetical protein
MKAVRGQVRYLLAGVLALGVLVIGVNLAVRGEGEKPAPKKEAPLPKKEAKEPERQAAPELPDFEEMLRRLQPAVGDDQLGEMRKHLEQVRRQMALARQRLGIGGLPVFPNAPFRGGFGVPGNFAPPLMQELRLGAHLRTPSKTLEDQLDLPKAQGMVLEDVGANSAAAKAGLKAHDILLELNGKPVPSKPEGFYKLVGEIKPNTPVEAVVMRKGRKETIKGLSLPEAKEAPRVAAPDVRGVPGFRPRLPVVPRFAALGGTTTFSRVNDDFTVANQNGDDKVTVKGKIEQGKPQVATITVETGGQAKTYESLDKMPPDHKEKAKKLVEMVQKGASHTPAPRRAVEEF